MMKKTKDLADSQPAAPVFSSEPCPYADESSAELRRKNQELETTVNTLTRELREKDALLREVYHRVKNNLQVVQSLINLGARRMASHTPDTVLKSIIERVHIMAMVHEKLYTSSDLTHLQLPVFLHDVAHGAIDSSRVPSERVKLNVEAVPIQLTLEHAVPFGMLVHELISNCLKHGLSEEEGGSIDIRVHRQNGSIRLKICDNGRGLPAGFDPRNCTSMGMQLAASFAHQLGGELVFSNRGGCCIETDLARLN